MRIAMAVLASAFVWAQTPPVSEPPREAGTTVTGAFEGWFKNADGSFSLLFGYYNRNRNQELDVPLGPENRIEPGGPDQGQPTHFVPGRAWGMFTVRVPADFGDKKLTWTLSSNGKTTSIRAHLKTEWEISPFREFSVNNTPPLVSFEENGPGAQGPRKIVAQRTAKAGAPLPLPVFVTDDAKYTSNSGARPKVMPPAVTLRWTLYRGPGSAVFQEERPPVAGTLNADGFRGKAATAVTFSQPGDYVLQVTANDYSGDGGAGFQCCWTTAQVHVSVSR